MISINDIKTQKKSCLRNDGYQVDNNNSLSLYVIVTRKCNANCEFCEFTGKSEKIDLDIFYSTFSKLIKYYNIGMVHFTGGEPTLELELLKSLCNMVKSIDDMVTTSVNTNGIKLAELADIDTLDNVALSRHALTDSENFDIFKTNTVAKESDIKAFPKNKLHLSCNLMQGYIDNEEKIYHYLNKCAALDIFDVGFVGLMPVNQYCIDRYVEYPELSKCTCTSSHKNIIDGVCTCECKNWLYRASNCNLISIYHRHACKSTNTVSYLVYENNKLKLGFNGDYISI